MSALEDLQDMSEKIGTLHKKSSCLDNNKDPENLSLLLQEMEHLHHLLEDLQNQYLIKLGIARLNSNKTYHEK